MSFHVFLYKTVFDVILFFCFLSENLAFMHTNKEKDAAYVTATR